MLFQALVFLLISLVAAALGFSGVPGRGAQLARILFVVSLVLLVVSLIAGRVIM